MTHPIPDPTAPDGRAPIRPLPAWLRRLALAAAVARYVIPLAAIPLIPVLVRQHLLLLVLLRPQKEFLLIGGAVVRTQGELSLWLLFAAYAPLMIVAVWAFFVVGRTYGHRLREGDGPRWLRRVVRPDQLEVAAAVLSKRGPAIAVLARVAAFPPTILAAAAGTSDVRAFRYLLADAAGALVAFAVTVGAGFLLGGAWQRGGVVLTGAGVLVFAVMVVLLTRWVQREARRHRV